ncbi:MAG: hypothetical protein L0211_14605 [Planctomycetaceae bacterium]|nr:hypothetical protein [Planctomycetaceae bacterium]
MQKRREVNPPSRAMTEDVGQLACGSSEDWEVSINQTLGARPHYALELDGPREYIRFRLINRQTVGLIHDYLSRVAGVANVSDDGSLVIGATGQSQVLLAWDDEFADRCFLIVGHGSNTLVRITFLERDVQAIREALSQALSDMAT